MARSFVAFYFGNVVPGEKPVEFPFMLIRIFCACTGPIVPIEVSADSINKSANGARLVQRIQNTLIAGVSNTVVASAGSERDVFKNLDSGKHQITRLIFNQIMNRS